MGLTKELALAQLEVDVEGGTIWLNAPHCVLRIGGIKFNNKEDRFTSIEVENSEGFLINNEDQVVNPAEAYALFDINHLINYNLVHNKKVIDKEAFLKLLFKEIKKFVDNY